MNRQEMALKLINEADFVNSPKHNNSLAEVLNSYPEGVSDAMICKMLCISQEELICIYKCAILKLRTAYGINDEEI
jgi:hypothetical protein